MKIIKNNELHTELRTQFKSSKEKINLYLFDFQGKIHNNRLPTNSELKYFI